MNFESLLAAFLVGLLGGAHCIGMCGGIVGALTGGLAGEVRTSRLRLLLTQLAYNTGRVASYTLAGVIAGLLGRQVSVLELVGGFPLGRLVAGVFMILLGCYIGGWWHALRWLESLGARAWKYIEPLGRRFIPVRHPGQALLLGLVWGWLPCGMVYAALALALASGSAIEGAAVMLAFGAGTLPTLLTLGVAFSALERWIRDQQVRRLAGLTVILLGVLLLLAKPAHHGHDAQPRPDGQHQHHGHVHPGT